MLVKHLLHVIHSTPALPVPEILNKTFGDVDQNLSTLAAQSGGKIHSGSTAVAAFMRVEDANGGQSFLTSSPVSESQSRSSSASSPTAAIASGDDTTDADDASKKTSSSSKIKQALKSLGSGSLSGSKNSSSSQPEAPPSAPSTSTVDNPDPPVVFPPDNTRRVLYCANAGDARGVLCRGGIALRLTYDHKGSDKQEAKRITDAGGFVMSGRVNGVLAVTRSLGDASMKEFVVGAPYTTETEICDEDEFLILACDGVRGFFLSCEIFADTVLQLWDITSDQKAVDHVRDIQDPQEQAEALVKFALEEHSQDNITIIVVRFKHSTQSTEKTS